MYPQQPVKLCQRFPEMVCITENDLQQLKRELKSDSDSRLEHLEALLKSNGA